MHYKGKCNSFFVLVLVVVCIKGVLVSAERVNVHEIQLTQKEQIYSRYLSLSQWPTDAEITQKKASSDETERSKTLCLRWLNFVLQPRWIPADIENKLIGLKRHPQDYDMFISEYTIKDYLFRIEDTSVELVVLITTPEFSDISLNWENSSTNILRTFLKHPEKVAAFQKANIYFLDDFAKRNFSYSIPIWEDNDPNRYWCDENPTLWTEPNSITFKFSKLRDSIHPMDDEFGLKQRFPAFQDQLTSATVRELVGLIAMNRDPNDQDARRKSSIAERLLMQKANRSEAIDFLVSEYGNGEKSHVTKKTIIETLKRISNFASELQVKEDVIKALETLLETESNDYLKNWISQCIEGLKREFSVPAVTPTMSF